MRKPAWRRAYHLGWSWRSRSIDQANNNELPFRPFEVRSLWAKMINRMCWGQSEDRVVVVVVGCWAPAGRRRGLEPRL